MKFHDAVLTEFGKIKKINNGVDWNAYVILASLKPYTASFDCNLGSETVLAICVARAARSSLVLDQ